MMTRAALRALLLATSTLVPFTVFAQPATSPAAQSGTADAIRVLLDQATYWRGQYQDDKANVALGRVLVLDPNNADALAMQAQAAADNGDPATATAALNKLKAARPDDPRIAGVEQALRTGPVDTAALAEARAAVKAGNSVDAVAAYRRAFKSDRPPPGLATEFYQVLAGTDEDWTIPRAGLAAVLRANPQDLRAQLAYAELLTYHDETRSEGIDRLGKLAQNPVLAERANADLRQSLTWLPTVASSIPQYDIYLAQHPDDAAIAKLAQAAKTNSGDLRKSGFDSLQDGNLADADTQFTGALKINPNDSDAMVGLGLVRLREQKFAEGKDLLKQAIVLDPTKADQYQPLIDGDTSTQTAAGGAGAWQATAGFRREQAAKYSAIYGRRIRAQYARIAGLINQGEFAQAEALLRKVNHGRFNAGTLAYLADIQAREGRLDEAEASYRSILAKNPRNVQAMGGLAGVLARQGKQDEANTLFAQAAALPGGGAVGAAHANALQAQAEQMTDPVAQIGMFRAAVKADPNNPWLRLELARALHSQQNDADAREVMASVAAGPHPTKDQLQAAIYFNYDLHDDATVVKLVDRMSTAQRTPQMLEIRTNAQLRHDIQEAKALGSKPAERERLLSLASQPDPTGARVGAIGTELIRMGDKPAAREAVRLALAASPATPQQRVAYGGTLLGAGYPEDARRVTQSVTPTNGVMTHQLAEVRDGAAVASSDKLNAAGNPAAAYDQLAPRLASSPDDPDLNMALARLYSTNQQPSKAVAITQNILQQNPSNLSVRTSAVYASLADGDYRQAATIAKQSTEQFPDEPQAWIDLANVERARGHSGAALRYLQTAKSLRQKQLEGQQSSAERDLKGPSTASVEPLRRRYAQYAQYIPANTASDVSPAALPEPVTRQYAQYDPSSELLPIEGAMQAQAPAPAPGSSPLVSTGYAPFTAVTPARADAGRANSAFVTAPAAPPVAPIESAPIQVAQSSPAFNTPASGNPFHPGATPLPTIDEPSAPGTVDTPLTITGTSVDPMTAQIDQGISQVKQEVAPRVDASLVVRGRTGTDGFEKLIEVAAPLEASYSPGDYGRLKVVVTPTYLYSGKSTDAFNTGRYGTNPLGTPGAPAASMRNQTAGGAALDVGYAYDIVTADVGASPLGFAEENVVGGIELAPKIAPNMSLRVLAERRVVTDSILSYGGLKDFRTGESWGGVTRNRGHVQIDGTAGLFNYYAGAGGGYLVGHNVASNTEIDAGIGANYAVWRTPSQEVRVGTDLVYFGYNKNLSGFSLGQGGYFSPHEYFAVLFPITYRNQLTPDFRFSVGGTVGFQTFTEKSSDVFPNDSALQSQLVALAASTPGLATTINSNHSSGVAGGVNGELDYRVNGNLHVGARAGFDHSGDFSEGTGLVYARYVFGDNL